MEKQKLNTTLVYVLAIIAFPCCCCAGLGIIPAAIAYFIANGKLKEAMENPEEYENIQAMNTAKIVTIIAIVINLIYLAFTIYRIATVGWDELMEQSRLQMEQYGWEQ
jgi:hypothetical protein